MTNNNYEFNSLHDGEKLNIVNSHIRNLEYKLYSNQIYLIEQNALQNPDSNFIAQTETASLELISQINALKAEAQSLIDEASTSE